MDQWDRFQSVEELEEVDDLLGYWSTRLKNPRWTQLSYMALEIHSIAAMSAQVERIFSRLVQSPILPSSNYSLNLYLQFKPMRIYSGKNLITDHRGWLSDEVIEAIECLKSWRKAKLIPEEGLSEVEVMVEDLEIQAIGASEMRGSGIISISGESDIQSDISIGVISG